MSSSPLPQFWLGPCEESRLGRREDFRKLSAGRSHRLIFVDLRSFAGCLRRDRGPLKTRSLRFSSDRRWPSPAELLELAGACQRKAHQTTRVRHAEGMLLRDGALAPMRLDRGKAVGCHRKRPENPPLSARDAALSSPAGDADARPLCPCPVRSIFAIATLSTKSGSPPRFASASTFNGAWKPTPRRTEAGLCF